MRITTVFLAACAAAPAPVRAETPLLVSELNLSQVMDRMHNLESSVSRMEKELTQLRANVPDYENASYAKAGLTLLFPERRSFDFPTDTGLGASVGFGHYFGRAHALEATLDWDAYLAGSLRYRYEFHLSRPRLTVGPLLGIKRKLAALRPFDHYLDQPDQVNDLFLLAGGILAFPINAFSQIAAEICWQGNGQAFLTSNLAVQLYF